MRVEKWEMRSENSVASSLRVSKGIWKVVEPSLELLLSLLESEVDGSGKRLFAPFLPSSLNVTLSLNSL